MRCGNKIGAFNAYYLSLAVNDYSFIGRQTACSKQGCGLIYAHMSSAFNVNSCFILQRNDVSKALCKRVGLIVSRQPYFDNLSAIEDIT